MSRSTSAAGSEGIHHGNRSASSHTRSVFRRPRRSSVKRPAPVTRPTWRTAIDCRGAHSTISIWSFSRNGPTFVAQSNVVPMPSRWRDVNVIASASAIQRTWEGMSASAFHTASTGAPTRRRTLIRRTRSR